MFRCYPSINHAKGSSDQSHDWHLNPYWFIQEKIDGSQLSFTRQPIAAAAASDGETRLHFYCGKAAKTGDAVLFAKVVAMVRSVEQQLSEGVTYHCEYVGKLRHNVVDYGRLPRMYLVLYDVQDVDGRFLQPSEMAVEADRLGLECAAVLADHSSQPQPDVNPVVLARSLLDSGLQSQLGGDAEGVVLKHHNYQHVKYSGQWRNGQLEEKRATVELVNKKLKLVSEQFKESRTVKRDKSQLTPTAFLRWIGQHYNTTARLRKGVQRLRDKHDITYNSECDTSEKAAYEQRLCTELDEDLMKEYGTVVRSYIAVEFHEFAKLCARVSRQPTTTEEQQVSLELQNDVIFQQLGENEWEQRMDEYVRVVCESARESLDVAALVRDTDCDRGSTD